jgi:tRNA(Ile)-lysidine synthase
LRRAIAQLRPSLADLGFRPLEQARLIAETGDVGAQASLPGGLVLSVGYNRLAIKREAAVLPATAPQLPGPAAIELPIPGRVELANNWIIEATEINAIDLEQVEANQDPWLAFIDPGDAQALHIRPRRPGERIQPLGLGGHSAKVKDLMINHKIDARLRPLWPLIASATHPIWLIGHHIDQRARVTATSRRVIQLHCRQNQPLHM